MANTTNLNLQKIQDTDYAGSFPDVYNSNLDIIDSHIAALEDLLNGDY